MKYLVKCKKCQKESEKIIANPQVLIKDYCPHCKEGKTLEIVKKLEE